MVLSPIRDCQKPAGQAGYYKSMISRKGIRQGKNEVRVRRVQVRKSRRDEVNFSPWGARDPCSQLHYMQKRGLCTRPH